jgi:hypothetical protein
MPYIRVELTDWFVIIEMKSFESVVSAVSLNEADYVSSFKTKRAGRNLT